MFEKLNSQFTLTFLHAAGAFLGMLDFHMMKKELREDLEMMGYSMEDANRLRAELIKVGEAAIKFDFEGSSPKEGEQR